MTINIDANIEFLMDGGNEYLLYKKINGYHIHISDFSFDHDDKKYNVYISGKGCNGKWFLFSINNQTFASNNVWIYADVKNKDFILQQELTQKPTGPNFIYAEFNLLPDDKKNVLIEYVLDRINFENKMKDDNKKFTDDFCKKHELICNIFMDSDECVLSVFKNLENDIYEYYCLNDIDDVYNFPPQFTSSDVITVYDYLIGKCNNRNRNFYDCTVYGDLNYKHLNNRFKRIIKHEIINKECEFQHKTPIHRFIISQVK